MVSHKKLYKYLTTFVVITDIKRKTEKQKHTKKKKQPGGGNNSTAKSNTVAPLSNIIHSCTTGAIH